MRRQDNRAELFFYCVLYKNTNNNLGILKKAFFLFLGIWILSCLYSFGFPSVGAEFDFGPPTYVGAPYGQNSPGIAFNGTTFFVVWVDNRNSQFARIFGTRVSTNGTVLDPAGIQIDPDSFSDSTSPAVISDGADFLVTWANSLSSHVYGRQVTAEGHVSETNLLDYSSWGSLSPPAQGGTNFLLVWSDGNDIYGNRIGRDGTILDATGFPICTVTNSQYSPVACPLGTNWLVVWMDNRREYSGFSYEVGDIFGTLISPSGTVLVTNGFSICSTNYQQSYPQLASLGNNCLVVWHDSRTSSTRSQVYLYGARVNSSGQVLDPNGFLIDQSRPYESLGKIASDGQNWLVTLSEQIDGYHCTTVGKTITPQGTIANSAVMENTLRGSSSPAVAFGGTNYFVVWESRRGDQSWMVDIVGARVTSANVVLDSPAPPVSLSASFQIQPAVVGDGTNYFCVWRDNRHGDGRWNIYGARITRQGVVLDPGGIPITSLDAVQTNPAVAFNGNHFFVVWLDTRTGYQNLYAARVSQDGQVMETNGFLIAQNVTTADVASLGTNFLVVWGDSNGKVSCTRVSDSGQVLDPAGIGLFSGSGSVQSAKVTSNNTNFFVTWAANYYGTMCVGSNGTILYSNYPAQFGITYVGTQLASDGQDFIGIRSDTYGVFGALFPNSGVIMSTFSVATEYYHSAGYLMAVAGNGKDYFLAYSPAYADSPANQGWPQCT